MPRGDGTGPQSQGSGTGKGQGGCKSGKSRKGSEHKFRAADQEKDKAEDRAEIKTVLGESKISSYTSRNFYNLYPEILLIISSIESYGMLERAYYI